MKYQDINTVVKLQEVALRISKQYDRLLDKEGYYKDVDCGGVRGVMDTGYLCHVSGHSDGSGSPIDLTGCYVGGEVFDAVQIILEEKFDKCKAALYDLGVDVTDMTLTEGSDK